MFKDAYDLDINCAGEQALAAYVAGIDTVLRLDVPGVTELTEAVRHDEEFALAHATLGRQLQITGFADQANAHLEQSIALKAGCSSREQSAIEVITAAAAFKPEALSMAECHAKEHPRDIFVIAMVLGPFGLLAFSGQSDWREKNVDMLRSTQSAYSADDWWHITTRSFMDAEMGQLDQARRDAERAWFLSENGNCAHTMAHVHFETDSKNEGEVFINDWLKAYGDVSEMRHHLLWHLALLRHESGTGDNLALYKSELDPSVCDPMPLSTFADNASLLWRCNLSDIDVPDDIRQDLLRYADAHFPDSGFAFADIHRVMAVALQRDQDRQQALLEELAGLSSEDEISRNTIEFAKGFFAFANGNYEATIERLDPVSSSSVLLGGSNPQRRIVAETLSEARRRAASER